MRLTQHQQNAIKLAKDKEFFALFMWMGSGKTRAALHIMEHWAGLGRKKFLVICPNSLRTNWCDEAAKWEIGLSIVALEGSANKRRKIIAGEWDILVVNYDACRNLSAEMIAAAPQGLILDESQRVKNRKAHQTKQIHEIAAAVRHNGGARIVMTGTPITKHPLDLWSQFDILNPSVAGKDHPLKWGNYVRFEREICIKTPHYRLGMRAPSYEFPEEKIKLLRARMAPFCLEVSKDEVSDLPERTFSVIRLDADPEQDRIYKQLKTASIALLDGGPTPDAEWSPEEWGEEPFIIEQAPTVSATMAATLLIRLQQTTSGFVKQDDGKIVDIASAKAKFVEEMLPDWTEKIGDNKVVIFTRYKHTIKVLRKIAEQLGIGCVTLSGDNSGDASELVKQFQTDPATRVFIANVAVGSVGLTLTAANYCVFFENSFLGEHRMQATERVHRMGQKRHVQYYDLVIKGTVDEKILALLEAKQNIARATIHNLREMLT